MGAMIKIHSSFQTIGMNDKKLWDRAKKLDSTSGPLSQVAMDWFKEEFYDDPVKKILIFTEAWVGVDGDLCRAHGNYRTNGPWYDFVVLNLAGAESEDIDPIPCRLAAIWRQECTNEDGSVRVLLHASKKQPGKDHHSILYSHWELESHTSQRTSKAFRNVILRECALDQLYLRAYCIDSSPVPTHTTTKKDQDPFGPKVATNSPNFNAPPRFEILWTDREEWPESFIKRSPQFLHRLKPRNSRRSTSKRSTSRGREASKGKKIKGS